MNGHQAPPADLMVMASPDGRFAMYRLDELIASVTPVPSVRDAVPAMARVLRALTWHSEDDIRAELARLGFSASAIGEHIAGARRKLAVATSAPIVMERLTEIGYRNADGQQVIGRTEQWRLGAAGLRVDPDSGQRVFAMRCTVCGAEYGAYGCDVDIRRCPSCQDGPPGVPL